MRSVIVHFYNEDYLLPWWLRHHRELFDHGVLIDHGSTDGSADLCRQLTPHWRLVRSRLMKFDAFLTDFEVMGYELELPGWKIALNVTEFLLPAVPLRDIEGALDGSGRGGCAATGLLAVDDAPPEEPDVGTPLPLQKRQVVDDNTIADPALRGRLGIQALPSRNRFYHRHPVGMYQPGRHLSFHPDAGTRVKELMVVHYAYAPWTEKGIARKLQIADRLPESDVHRGWGLQHTRKFEQLEQTRQAMLEHATDLSLHPFGRRALARLQTRGAAVSDTP